MILPGKEGFGDPHSAGSVIRNLIFEITVSYKYMLSAPYPQSVQGISAPERGPPRPPQRYRVPTTVQLYLG